MSIVELKEGNPMWTTLSCRGETIYFIPFPTHTNESLLWEKWRQNSVLLLFSFIAKVASPFGARGVEKEAGGYAFLLYTRHLFDSQL